MYLTGPRGFYDFVLGTPGNPILKNVQSPFFDGASNDNIFHLYDPDADQVIFMAEYKCNTTDVEFNSINSTNTYDEIRLDETVSGLSLTENQTIYACNHRDWRKYSDKWKPTNANCGWRNNS